QPRSQRAQVGLGGCAATGEAFGRRRTVLELRARTGATRLAYADARPASLGAGSRAFAESNRSSARTSLDQAVQRGQRWRQRVAHSLRPGRRPDRPRAAGLARRSSLALPKADPGGCLAWAVPRGASSTAGAGAAALGNTFPAGE